MEVMQEEKSQVQPLPKVFVDGYSLVKISLVNNFVNCTNYVSRSGFTFEGCMEYKNNNIEDVRGIYYIIVNRIFSFHARRKIARNSEEMNEIIQEIIPNKEILKYLGLNNKEKLLIRYGNYGISVYDKYIKGKTLKFPLQGEQGHLKISWISKLNFQSLQLLQLQFKKVTQLEIYNHSIRFEKEVIEFGMTRFGGDAKLIYNQNDIPISVKLFSPDHGEEAMDLEANQLYLFAHPRPQRQKFID